MKVLCIVLIRWTRERAISGGAALGALPLRNWGPGLPPIGAGASSFAGEDWVGREAGTGRGQARPPE
jgi:hypothetical protein